LLSLDLVQPVAIERRRPFGAIDEQRLGAFERSLPAPLPRGYRNFLVEFNGARILECPEFDEVPGGTNVDTLYGLHEGPPYERLDDARENFAGTVPPSLVIIGSDSYGNYLGLDLGTGEVFFVDHEALPATATTLVRVASSFAALLERVGGDVLDRPPPRTATEAVEQRDADALRAIFETGVTAAGLVHRAVRTGHPEIVRLVVDHGGDANERGGIGETPLFVAARDSREDICALLLAHGADPNAKCNAGGTAMEMAAPWPKVVEVLARAGATPTTNRLRVMVRRILGGE
jgi:hypothetical protein